MGPSGLGFRAPRDRIPTRLSRVDYGPETALNSRHGGLHAYNKIQKAPFCGFLKRQDILAQAKSRSCGRFMVAMAVIGLPRKAQDRLAPSDATGIGGTYPAPDENVFDGHCAFFFCSKHCLASRLEGQLALREAARFKAVRRTPVGPPP